MPSATELERDGRARLSERAAGGEEDSRLAMARKTCTALGIARRTARADSPYLGRADNLE